MASSPGISRVSIDNVAYTALALPQACDGFQFSSASNTTWNVRTGAADPNSQRAVPLGSAYASPVAAPSQPYEWRYYAGQIVGYALSTIGSDSLVVICS